MIKVSHPIGFAIGFMLGVYTRENHLYPHPIRVSDLEEDFSKMDKQVRERKEALKQTVQKMKDELQVQQGVYMAMKHVNYSQEAKKQTKKAQNPKQKSKK